MAKAKLKKAKLAQKQAQQKAYRPGARLQEAQQAFNSGNLAQALTLAEAALRAANDPSTQKSTQALLVELYFRQAAAGTVPAERLNYLNKALEQVPDQTRLHYHRALTRWRMGNTQQAVAELAFVARQEPKRPSLPFLGQLGRVATGEAWHADGLSPAEANTLHLLARLHAGEPADQIAATVADKPLLGTKPDLWTLLLHMLVNPKSAPLGGLQAAAQSEVGTTPNPVLSYYQGVAALRKGDVGDAQTFWRQAAQRLATTWVGENLLLWRRDLAAQWAQDGRWQEIIQLYAATKKEVTADALDAVLVETAGIAYYHLGYAAAQANEWPLAVQHWRAADGLIKSRQLSQNVALAEEALGNWGEAAEAWREMVRRRPRKADHPDYLTDVQVAMIWQRAAKCYQEAENSVEEISCLKNAIKYAPEDLALRIILVDVLLQDDRDEAAENELDRILAGAPAHVPALMRLGLLYDQRYDRDPMPIWQRVLAVEPANADARQALAMQYVQIANDEFEYRRHYGDRSRLTAKKTIEILQTGLKELPDHPLLLLGLGESYKEQRKNDKARTYYQQAAQAAPRDVKMLDLVLHELLHVDGGAIVKELTPQVRQISGLRPGFWVDQGERVLQCKLGVSWAEFFWQEASAVAATMSGEDSPAITLVNMFDAAYKHEQIDLARTIEQKLRKNYPASGGAEYIEAQYARKATPDKTGPALALLRKAKANATKAGEPAIVELAEGFEQFIKRPPSGFGRRGLQDMFAELFGNLGVD